MIIKIKLRSGSFGKGFLNELGKDVAGEQELDRDVGSVRTLRSDAPHFVPFSI